MYSVKSSTSERSWLVYNLFLTVIYNTIKCKDKMYIYIKTGFKAANLISFSKSNPSCVLNFKTTNSKNDSNILLF